VLLHAMVKRQNLGLRGTALSFGLLDRCRHLQPGPTYSGQNLDTQGFGTSLKRFALVVGRVANVGDNRNL